MDVPYKAKTYYLDTNRICPQKLSIAGKELSMPDPWLRILEWRTYNNKFVSSASSSSSTDLSASKSNNADWFDNDESNSNTSIEVEILAKNETSNKVESSYSSDADTSTEVITGKKLVIDICGK